MRLKVVRVNKGYNPIKVYSAPPARFQVIRVGSTSLEVTRSTARDPMELRLGDVLVMPDGAKPPKEIQSLLNTGLMKIELEPVNSQEGVPSEVIR